jgi:hypothetical protein
MRFQSASSLGGANRYLQETRRFDTHAGRPFVSDAQLRRATALRSCEPPSRVIANDLLPLVLLQIVCGDLGFFLRIVSHRLYRLSNEIYSAQVNLAN